jgi:hypothetical protein
MSATIKKVLTFTLITFLLISFSEIASARKSRPVWHKGMVTKAAWTEGQTMCIELDDEKYTLLPLERVKITRQYKAPNGQWVSEKLPLERVYIGTTVLIRVVGLEIHQLIVEEK